MLAGRFFIFYKTGLRFLHNELATKLQSEYTVMRKVGFASIFDYTMQYYEEALHHE